MIIIINLQKQAFLDHDVQCVFIIFPLSPQAYRLGVFVPFYVFIIDYFGLGFDLFKKNRNQ